LPGWRAGFRTLPSTFVGRSSARRRYHPLVRARLTIDTSLLKPGMRLGVGLSGEAENGRTWGGAGKQTSHGRWSVGCVVRCKLLPK